MLENVLHVILTVTQACNLHCVYCFEPDQRRHAPEKMTLECFQKFLAVWAADRARAANSGAVDICFHGGEPTLAGIPLLQSFVDEARRRLGARVTFGLQTNGTLLDAGWAKFMADNQISLSVSLDGLDQRSNRLRLLQGQRLDDLLAALKKMPRFGLLALLTRNNLQHIWPFIRRAFRRYRLNSLRVNLMESVVGRAASDEELNGRELAERFYLPFLRRLYLAPHCKEHNTQALLRDFVVGYLYVRQAEPPDGVRALCGAKFCGMGNGIINLLPDGALWACQRSLGLPACRLGSIYARDAAVFGLPNFYQLWSQAYQMARSIRARGCDVCFAADICDYGCQAFSLLKTAGRAAIRPEITCACYQTLKKHLARDAFNYIVLFALLNAYPIQKNGKNIRIQMPVQQQTIKGSYQLLSNNLSGLVISGQRDDGYVEFAWRRLSLRGRAAVFRHNLRQRSKK